jgi:integrase
MITCRGCRVRFREKQTYLLGRWVLPRIGAWKVTAWTSADSSAVIAAVRPARCSDALVQDVGAAMRALVTHARRLRWLTTHSEDPMCMVRYAKTASIQGAASVYVPRSTLPTDEQCAALFDAMAELGHRRWAVAMRLTHRSGLRWGELVALQAHDIEFEPARVVHVGRAVEQPTRGPARLKTPERQDPHHHLPQERCRRSPCPPRRDDGAGRARRAVVPERVRADHPAQRLQQVWIRAAEVAGWPMTIPLQRSAGYGQTNKGWRWTGAAKWSPHDLRHVAACWMLFDLGLDPAVVADKLGHADPNFTIKRYIGVRGNADVAAMTVTDHW